MIKSKLSVKISFLFAVLSIFFSTFLFFSCKNFNFNSKSKIVVTLPGKMLGGGSRAITNPENYTASNISSWTVNLISIGKLGSTSNSYIYQSKTEKSGSTVSFDLEEEIPLRVEVIGYSESKEILLLGKSENFTPKLEETTEVSVTVYWNYLSVKAENLNVSLNENNEFTLRVRVDCKESEKENISFKWYKSSTKSEENLPPQAILLEETSQSEYVNSQSPESDYYENYYSGTYSSNNPEYYYCLVTRKYDYVGISNVEKLVGPFQINAQSGQQGGDSDTPGGEQGGEEQGGGEQEPSEDPITPTLTSITATYSIDKSITRTKDNDEIQVPSVSDFEITENYSDSTTQPVTEKTNYSVAWKNGVTTTTAIGAVPVVITKKDENFTCEATVPVKYTIDVYNIDTTEQKIDAEKNDVATKTLGSQINAKTWQLWKNNSSSEQTDSFTYSWKDEQNKPIENENEATYNAPLNVPGTISYTRTHTITPVDLEYFDGTDDNSYNIVYWLTVTDTTPSGQDPSTPGEEQGGEEQGGGEQEPSEDPITPTLTSITATYSIDKSITRTKDNDEIQVPNVSDFEITEIYSNNTTQPVTDKTNYSVAWKTGVTTTTAIGAVPVVITKKDENFTCEATVPVKYTIDVYNIDTTEQKIDAEKNDVATKTLGSQINAKTWQLWKNNSSSEQTDSFTYSWKDEQNKPIENENEATYNAPLNVTGTISYTRTHTITPVDLEYFDGTDTYEIVYNLNVKEATLSENATDWDSLKTAIEKISTGSGTVTLTGTTYTATTTNADQGSIVVSGNVKIVPNSADVTISRGGGNYYFTAPLFTIESGATLNIQANNEYTIVLDGARDDNSKGTNQTQTLIECKGNLEISENVTLKNNLNESGDGGNVGGAIYVHKDAETNAPLPSLKFNGTIQDCTAQQGGAIYVSVSDNTNKISVELNGATISGNTANGLNNANGGAIYLYNAEANFTNVNFTNNTTNENGSGGAIYVDGENTKITLSACSFSGNTANKIANSLYFVAGTATCDGKTLDSNIKNYVFGNDEVTSTTPEGFVSVSGATFGGTENWTPASQVFASGREITIRNLLVCDHEVTRNEYKSIMNEDPSTLSALDEAENGVENTDNHPVDSINWYNAIKYCNLRSMKENLTPCYKINSSTDPNVWGNVPTEENDETWDAVECDFDANGYRLPTEAEWEYLARGGNVVSTEYSGSDKVDEVAWYDKNSNLGTHEVKTKKANGLGIYDMSGNVWEWCWDWSGDITVNTPDTGEEDGVLRIYRGGFYYSAEDDVKISSINASAPYFITDGYQGFRVVRTISE